MLVTKVMVFHLVLVYVFNFDLFEFSAAILEKGTDCSLLQALGPWGPPSSLVAFFDRLHQPKARNRLQNTIQVHLKLVSIKI